MVFNCPCVPGHPLSGVIVSFRTHWPATNGPIVHAKWTAAGTAFAEIFCSFCSLLFRCTRQPCGHYDENNPLSHSSHRRVSIWQRLESDCSPVYPLALLLFLPDVYANIRIRIPLLSCRNRYLLIGVHRSRLRQF